MDKDHSSNSASNIPDSDGDGVIDEFDIPRSYRYQSGDVSTRWEASITLT